MASELHAWLEQLNAEMAALEVPHITRPFEAMSRLSTEQKLPIFLDSPVAQEILRWFQEHSPPGSHAIGCLFEGVLYFDAYFWSLDIPVGFGTFELNAFNSLRNMPDNLKKVLLADKEKLPEFLSIWVDSLDYAFGMTDLRQGEALPGFSGSLTRSGDRDLRACAKLLRETRLQSSKALEVSRMATELFLKAYLVQHDHLSEHDAQKILRHDLAKAAERCLQIHKKPEHAILKRFVTVFPPVSERYSGNTYEKRRLWQGYFTALLAGVTLVRSVTSRDARKQLNAMQPR